MIWSLPCSSHSWYIIEDVRPVLQGSRRSALKFSKPLHRTTFMHHLRMAPTARVVSSHLYYRWSRLVMASPSLRSPGAPQPSGRVLIAPSQPNVKCDNKQLPAPDSHLRRDGFPPLPPLTPASASRGLENDFSISNIKRKMGSFQRKHFFRIKTPQKKNVSCGK